MCSRIWAVLVAVCLLLGSSSCHSAAAVAQQESYSEEAVVQPLANGLVLVHFQFTQTAPLLRHYTIFPKAVGQLVSASLFDEFQLSLTQGRWEFVAKFSPLLPAASLAGQWGTLSHALGSLFCASLNFVARPEATATQAIAMSSCSEIGQQACSSSAGVSASQTCSGSSSSGSSVCTGGSSWVPAAARQHVLVASLPQEASCTENLTPWLKLLPCRDAAGLGALLADRRVVFGADHHSMQVSMIVERNADLQPLRSTLTQSLTLVLRPPPGTHPATISSSGAARQQLPAVLADVNLSALLGSEVKQACPLAQQSRVYVRLPVLDKPQQQQQQQQSNVQLQWRIPAYKKRNVPDSSNSLEAASADADEGASSGGSSDGSSSDSSAEQDSSDVADTAAEAERTELSQQQQQQQQQQQRSRRRLCRVARAASWSGPGVELSPAPDAAAALTHSTPNASEKRRQQGQQQPAQVMYVYDLLSPAHDAVAAGAQRLFQLQWAAGGSPGDSHSKQLLAEQQQQSRYTVTRYIAGSGNLHGGMVLEVHQAQQAAAAAAAADDGRNVSVCIFQVVPWQIRVWLHTLQLSIDGQRRSLDALLTHRHITPARDRTRPLVLNMCLALPAAATTLTLSAQFSKAFLTVAEYPPDAHRGFDVPAAQVTIGLTSLQTSGSSAGQQGDASSSSSSWAWHVHTGDGAEAWQQQQLQQELPLMQALAAVRPVQVYSPSLVVPLAVPDFSMPYNVICLTSTVLAVLLGAVVGALLLRPAEAETQAHASSAASAAQKRRKRVKVVLLLAVFGGLGLYLDPSLQEALWEQLTALGLA
uniref:GPI transamidase component PIG-T n=1 Tax=Tetradesmus obliquus TaxID=3088 RepID=A0A383WL46_TETOB|eukprot:jgi/Sobl393_1/7668/SZX78190.1